jgi:hypothetical protein
VVTALQEEGGEVVAGIAVAAGAQASARIVGTVLDSTSGGPVAGAVVTLEGAGRTVYTDSAGHFVIDSITAGGRFRLRFWHPRLDSLGIGMPATMVEVRRGEQVTTQLGLPGPWSLARTRCGDTSPTSARLVTGIVRERGDERPAGGADVMVIERIPMGANADSSSTDNRPSLLRRRTFTNENGRYAVCGLGARGVAWVTSRTPGGQWGHPVPIPRNTMAAAVDLVVSRNVADPHAGSDEFSLQFPALELARSAAPSGDAAIEGWILFPDEPPSVPVQILVDGRIASTARSSGEFLVERAGTGERQIAFRANGYVRTSVAVDVHAGESVLFAVAMQRVSAVILARATHRVVPGEEWRTGFEQRRKSGQGFFLDQEGIRRRGGQTLADLLRGVPGVRLVPAATGYHYESTRSADAGAGAFAGNEPLDRCEMMFYVDGQPFLIEEGAVDSNVRSAQIAALEVYASAATVPKQFAGARAACGVIVIWLGET